MRSNWQTESRHNVSTPPGPAAEHQNLRGYVCAKPFCQPPQATANRK